MTILTGEAEGGHTKTTEEAPEADWSDAATSQGTWRPAGLHPGDSQRTAALSTP
jgi:hypothetical protein